MQLVKYGQVPHDLAAFNRKGSINGGSPKCMVDKGNSYL